MKRVYIAVINDLATDQRVSRVAKLLVDQGMEICLIGRKFRNSPDPAVDQVRVLRYRMLFTRGLFFYAFYNLRLWLTLVFSRKPDLFISNDLDTLPACYFASRIRKVPLIYDSHELFTQVPELIHRTGVQSVWKWIEHSLVPRVDHAVTVSQPIARIYRALYRTRFRVVRNVPEKKMAVPVVKNSQGGMQTIIYQGALNVGRGLELMIETMKYLEDTLFVIAGTGDIQLELQQKVELMGLAGRVVFKGRLKPEELSELTMSADLGISLEEDQGLNYRYALPNKLFDYIQARVPVLCSALPEMKRVVDTYGVGIATEEREPEKLAEIIRYMLKERSGGKWREALDRASAVLCWENESEIYLELVRECGL